MSIQANSTKATRGVKGKGTVHAWGASKSPNTKYRAKLPITLPDGKKKTIYGYGPTKTAASRNLDAKTQLALKKHPSASTLTFHQAFAKLLEAKKIGGKKQKTLLNDVDLYTLHLKPYLADKPLADITFEDLQEVQYRIISKGRYRTAQLATIMLKSVYKHALKLYKREILEGTVRLLNLAEDLTPVKVPPHGRKPKPTPWSEAHLDAFFTESEARYRRTLRSLMHPLFYTAVAAGLRRGELLNLRWDALGCRNVTVAGETYPQHYLAITRQYIYYRGKLLEDTPKSEAGVRDVPIPETLYALLMEHKDKLDKVGRANSEFHDLGLVFPNYNGAPLQPRNIYRSRDEIIEKLSLPPSTLHQMRKVYTTYLTRKLLREGTYSPKIIQELLGHSTPDVAQEVYTLVIEADRSTATFDPLVDLVARRLVSEGAEEEKFASSEKSM